MVITVRPRSAVCRSLPRDTHGLQPSGANSGSTDLGPPAEVWLRAVVARPCSASRRRRVLRSATSSAAAAAAVSGGGAESPDNCGASDEANATVCARRLRAIPGATKVQPSFSPHPSSSSPPPFIPGGISPARQRAAAATAATIRTASAAPKQRPRPHSAALARSSHRVVHEDEVRLHIREIFELCEQLHMSPDFVTALQRNLLSHTGRASGRHGGGGGGGVGGGGPDLMMLRALRDSLLQHKAATLHVLRLIEARERVLTCLQHFVENTASQSSPLHAGARRGSSSTNSGTTQSGSGGGDSSESSGANGDGKRRGWVDPAVQAEGKAIAESLQQCGVGVAEALAQWHRSRSKIVDEGAEVGREFNGAANAAAAAFQRTSAAFRWRGHDYTQKMLHDADFFASAKSAWDAALCASAEEAEQERRDASSPLHIAAKAARIRADEEARSARVRGAALDIQRVYRGHRARQWFDYFVMKHNAAKSIQRCVRRRLLSVSSRAVRERVNEVVSRVQALWRGTLQRRRTAALRHQVVAATRIQRWLRSCHARHLSHIALLTLATRDRAAHCLTRFAKCCLWRSRACRHRRRRDAAIAIQRWVRSVPSTSAAALSAAVSPPSTSNQSPPTDSPLRGASTPPLPRIFTPPRRTSSCSDACTVAERSNDGGSSLALPAALLVESSHSSLNLCEVATGAGESAQAGLSSLGPARTAAHRAAFFGRDVTAVRAVSMGADHTISEHAAAPVFRGLADTSALRPPFAIGAPFWAGDLEAAQRIQAAWAGHQQRQRTARLRHRLGCSFRERALLERQDGVALIVQAFATALNSAARVAFCRARTVWQARRVQRWWRRHRRAQQQQQWARGAASCVTAPQRLPSAAASLARGQTASCSRGTQTAFAGSEETEGGEVVVTSGASFGGAQRAAAHGGSVTPPQSRGCHRRMLEDLRRRKGAVLVVERYALRFLMRLREARAQPVIARAYRRHRAHRRGAAQLAELRSRRAHVLQERAAREEQERESQRRREAALEIAHFIVKARHDTLLTRINARCAVIAARPDRHEAARRIQLAWRLSHARRIVAVLLRKRHDESARRAELERRSAAATAIQAAFRRFVHRDVASALQAGRAQHRAHAVVLLQRCGRRYLAHTAELRRRLEATAMFRELQRITARINSQQLLE